jgi:hypothetical protein
MLKFPIKVLKNHFLWRYSTILYIALQILIPGLKYK